MAGPASFALPTMPPAPPAVSILTLPLCRRLRFAGLLRDFMFA